jgi:hypothetical protein
MRILPWFTSTYKANKRVINILVVADRYPSLSFLPVVLTSSYQFTTSSRIGHHSVVVIDGSASNPCVSEWKPLSSSIKKEEEP